MSAIKLRTYYRSPTYRRFRRGGNLRLRAIDDRNHRWGFTLIELIVALAIFSIIGVAVYTSLGMGIQAWRRGEIQERAYQDIRICLEVMSKDLRNAIDIHDVPFQGAIDELRFAVLDNVEMEPKVFHEVMGLVRYRVVRKGDQAILYRKATQFPGEPDEKSPGIPILRNIQKFALEYYGYEESADQDPASSIDYTWSNTWDSSGELPRGVQLTLHIQPQQSDERVIVISKKMRVWNGSGKRHDEDA